MILIGCRWNADAITDRQSVQNLSQTKRGPILRGVAAVVLAVVDMANCLDSGHQLTPVGDRDNVVD